MAKKPRSQQRKKGQTMGADGSEEGANGGNSNADFLPEDHTVADSSVASASQFDEDFSGKCHAV
jgi:hypothetical protein